MDERLPDLGPQFSGRYRIERFIARGGMADVYLARDLRHDRAVALKLLRREHAAALLAERFLREIHFIAQLAHPHILPVLDSGDDAGVFWFAMPFIEDETLEARQGRGPVPLREAVLLCAEMADALAYAHRHHVIHRDVKPGNILLSGGHAVLTDFGIAKSMDTGLSPRISQQGFLLGTPSYMSPEQASGAEHLDGRSDVYSLGCVLYELATGQPPYGGRSPHEIIAGHLSLPVPDPRELASDIPDGVREALRRALAKSRDDRFPDAEAFAAALRECVDELPLPATRGRRSGARRRRIRRWGLAAAAVGVLVAGAALLRPVSAPSADERLAVLYLRDLSPDGRWQGLADLLTEDLIDRLSGIPSLRVLSAGSVLPLRGRVVPYDSLRRQGVGAVVAGTLAPEGDSLRVVLRLVDARTGDQWSSVALTASPARSFELRDALADAATGALRGQLGSRLRTQQLRAGTRRPEAWHLMEEGEALRRRHWVAYGGTAVSEAIGAIERADSLFGEAARADPTWTAPLLAQGLTSEWLATALLPDRARAQARLRTGLTRVDQALTLRPDNAEAVARRGMLRYDLCCVVSDPPDATVRGEAEGDLIAATRSDPDLASAWSTLSLLYQVTGRPTEAAHAAREAYQRDLFLDDPASALSRLLFAVLESGGYPEADQRCREGQRRFPGDIRFAECRLIVWGSGGDRPAQVDSSWAELARVEADPNALDYPGAKASRRAWVAMLLARLGHTDSARHVLTRLERTDTTPDARSAIALPVAYVWLLLGDQDSALGRLNEAITVDHLDPGVIARSRWFRRLQGDPRFEALLGRSGGS